MKKLKKLSALLILSACFSVSAFGSVNEGEKTSENGVSSNNGITEGYSISDVKETSGIFDSAKKRKFSIYAGYSGNFKNTNREVEKNNKYNHIIEVGTAYTRQYSSNLGYSVYAGSDVLFNSDVVLVGPKAGLNLNYSLFILGGEFIGYSDFNHAKPFFKPYAGIGVGPVKVTFGYNIQLGNKATFKHNINSFTLGATIPFFWGGE